MEAFGATASRVAVDWPLNTRRRKVDAGPGAAGVARDAHLAGGAVLAATMAGSGGGGGGGDAVREPLTQAPGDSGPNPSQKHATRIRVAVPTDAALHGGSEYRKVSGGVEHAHGGGGGLRAGAAREPPAYEHGLPAYLHETAEQPIARGTAHLLQAPDEARGHYNEGGPLHALSLGPSPPPDPDTAPHVRGVRYIGRNGWPVEMHRGHAQAPHGPMKRETQGVAEGTYEGIDAKNQRKKMFYDEAGRAIGRNTMSVRHYEIKWDLDSRLRKVESRATGSTGFVSPTDPNFPPTYDAEGRWLDHDSRLVRRTSGFSRRPARTYDPATLRPPSDAEAAAAMHAATDAAAAEAIRSAIATSKRRPAAVGTAPASIGAMTGGLGVTSPPPQERRSPSPLPSPLRVRSPSRSPASDAAGEAMGAAGAGESYSLPPAQGASARAGADGGGGGGGSSVRASGSVPLLERGVLRAMPNLERGLRDFGHVSVGVAPRSGPTQAFGNVRSDEQPSLSVSLRLGLRHAASEPAPVSSPLAAEATRVAELAATPRARAAQLALSSSSSSSSGAGDGEAKPAKLISPKRVGAPPNSLAQSFVPREDLPPRKIEASTAGGGARGDEGGPFGVAAAGVAAAVAAGVDRSALPVKPSVAARQQAVRGGLHYSTMLPRDQESYGADLDVADAAAAARQLAVTGHTQGPAASSLMNATLFSLPDAELRAEYSDARATTPAIPDRATAYLGVPTRTTVFESGEVRSSVQFPGTRGGAPGGRTLQGSGGIRVPTDVGVAELPRSTRAGSPSNRETPPVPRLLTVPELASAGKSIADGRGGNALQALGDQHYGKLSASTYLRTDWETLAPIAVGLGADAEGAAAAAARLTASGQGGASAQSAVGTLAPGRVTGPAGAQRRPATVHNALRRHAGLNTPSPGPILSVPPPRSTAQLPFEEHRGVHPHPEGRQIMPHSPLRSRSPQEGSRSPSPPGPTSAFVPVDAAAAAASATAAAINTVGGREPGGDGGGAVRDRDREWAVGFGVSAAFDGPDAFRPGPGRPATSPIRGGEDSPGGRGSGSPPPGSGSPRVPPLPLTQMQTASPPLGSDEAVAALRRSGAPSPVLAVAAQSENVVKSTLTDVHPPNEDLRRSTLGRLSAALDREGVTVRMHGRKAGEAPAASAGNLVLVPAQLTRRSEPNREVVRPAAGFGHRSTDVQNPVAYSRSAFGKESLRELAASSPGGVLIYPIPTLLMPASYISAASDYVSARAPQPFPMEPERLRVVHVATSADAGELHHHATLRGHVRSVAPPPDRATVRDRFGPPVLVSSPRSGRSAGGVWHDAVESRVVNTARSYGSVIAQLHSALSTAS